MRAGRVTVAVLLAATFVGTGCSGGSDDGRAEARRFFAGADCAALRGVLDQSDLAATLNTGDDPTADLQATAKFFDHARKDAPEGVAADVKVLAKAYSELADQARTVDWAGIRAGKAAASVGAAQLGRLLADGRFSRAAFHLSRSAAASCTR